MFDKLIIFEMANNHNGDVNHARKIILAYSEISALFPEFKFAIKFQYRNLDTFIHPDFQDDFSNKYVERFTKTRLTDEEFLSIKKYAEDNDFLTICTPFDEDSVDKIVEHEYDYIKIASASTQDWSLLEKIATTNLPVIVSTATSSLEGISNVIKFFQNREKVFAIMHCVAEYPTKEHNLQLNQISLLKNLFNVPVGFSTHENPENYKAIQLAIAQGATIFERHIDIASYKYKINDYSSEPYQIRQWLQSASESFTMCGIESQRHNSTDKEISDLRRFKRGAFSKVFVKKGEKIKPDNIFFAFPCSNDQYLAEDFSKYSKFVAIQNISPKESLIEDNVRVSSSKSIYNSIFSDVRWLLLKSDIALPKKFDMQFSHHYGIERFRDYGVAIITIINREYAKKILVLLPKQDHPMHYHVKKEETFNVLFGSMQITCEGLKTTLHKGDMFVVEREKNHSFYSEEGCVFEEISSTHYNDDSFYDDKTIMENYDNRKTNFTLTLEELKGCE